MQKHLFDSERDNEIRELNKLREDLKNKLYETNKKLAGVIRVRGIALNPIASIDRLDDGIHVVLSLGSGKNWSQYFIETTRLVYALEKLGVIPENKNV